jgi:hypothetical protein
MSDNDDTLRDISGIIKALRRHASELDCPHSIKDLLKELEI